MAQCQCACARVVVEKRVRVVCLRVGILSADGCALSISDKYPPEI